MGMFTELAIAYSKYKEEKLMEHLKMYSSRINIPKAIRACEDAYLWREYVYLYVQYDEFDNAALAIMQHAAVAWEHDNFKNVIVKVTNLEYYYKVRDPFSRTRVPYLTWNARPCDFTWMNTHYN